MGSLFDKGAKLDPTGLAGKSNKEARRSFGKGDKPEKTAQEVAMEKRQMKLLDKETQETEAQLKAMARGRLGAQSLLGGTGRTQEEAATKSKGNAAAVAGGSMLGSAPRTSGGSRSSGGAKSMISSPANVRVK